MVYLNLYANFFDPIKLFVKDMFWHPLYNSSCSSVCFNEFSSSLDISSRWWCHNLYEIHKSTLFPYHHLYGCTDTWCIRWIIMTCILGKDISILGMMILLKSFSKWLWLSYRIHRVHFHWCDAQFQCDECFDSWVECLLFRTFPFHMCEESIGYFSIQI